MPSSHAQEIKRILIINSYHAGYKGSDDLLVGIKKAFDESSLTIDAKIEYLDGKHFSGPEHDMLVLNTLRAKYHTNGYDLLLTTDDYAFTLVERYRDELFGKVPVIFVGTNYFDATRIQGKPDFIGIDESPSFGDTLNLMLLLHADTKRIVAIHDDSDTGMLNSKAFHLAAAGLTSRIDIEGLAGLPMEAVLDAVKRFEPGTLAVYFASNVKDSEGVNISSNDALREIAAISPVPIYGGWAFSLGSGIVGGRLIDLKDHGEAAGRLALRLISGESISRMASVSPSPNTYSFDHMQLERFGIDKELLPPDSRIINEPDSPIEKHQTELLVFMTVLLVLVVSVSFVRLSTSRRNLAIANERLLESEAMLRDIAHHDSLTGLANRLLFRAHLEQAILRVRRSRQGLSLMMIDLDGFKLINDSHGHHAGDEMLCEIAKRLTALLRKSDFVARLGGDEFVAVFEGVCNQDASDRICDKIVAHLGAPFSLSSGDTVSVGASVGAAILNEADTSQTLFRRADRSMYKAKSDGKNRCRLAS